MNKYSDQSRTRDIRHQRTCSRKRGYETEQEAFQKGAIIYLCPYCKKYHRSIHSLVAIAARKTRDKNTYE